MSVCMPISGVDVSCGGGEKFLGRRNRTLLQYEKAIEDQAALSDADAHPLRLPDDIVDPLSD